MRSDLTTVRISRNKAAHACDVSSPLAFFAGILPAPRSLGRLFLMPEIYEMFRAVCSASKRELRKSQIDWLLVRRERAEYFEAVLRELDGLRCR
jgi:hypothetical protein